MMSNIGHLPIANMIIGASLILSTSTFVLAPYLFCYTAHSVTHISDYHILMYVYIEGFLFLKYVLNYMYKHVLLVTTCI